MIYDSCVAEKVSRKYRNKSQKRTTKRFCFFAAVLKTGSMQTFFLAQGDASNLLHFNYPLPFSPVGIVHTGVHLTKKSVEIQMHMVAILA